MKGIKKALILIVYLVVASYMYYAIQLVPGAIQLGSFNIMYMYLAGMAIILVAFVRFLVEPDVARIWLLGKYGIWVMIPMLLSVYMALISWVVNLTDFGIIIRGLFGNVYQIIAVFVAMSSVYLFGSRAVIWNWLALVAANIYGMVLTISDVGLSVFFQDMATVVTSLGGTTSAAMGRMETLGLTYAFGMYMLYYVFCHKKKNLWDILVILVSTFFFLMAFKRSASGALALAVAAGLVLCVLPETACKRTITLMGLAMIGGSMAYIWVVRSGLYDVVTVAFNIDTSGRSYVYNNLKPYYDFSPSFMGLGMGYVTKMLQTGELNLGINVTDLHNDLLREYVEQGFWSYLLWLLALFFLRIKLFARRHSRMGIMVFVMTAFLFVLYFSENIYMHYYTNVTVDILIMSYLFEDQVENEKRITPWL